MIAWKVSYIKGHVSVLLFRSVYRFHGRPLFASGCHKHLFITLSFRHRRHVPDSPFSEKFHPNAIETGVESATLQGVKYEVSGILMSRRVRRAL